MENLHLVKIGKEKEKEKRETSCLFLNWQIEKVQCCVGVTYLRNNR